MAEHENTQDLDELRDILSSGSCSANGSLMAFIKKKDYDSAIDSMEQTLDRKDDEVDKLLVVNNMKVAMYLDKLYTGGSSSPLFTRAFGGLGKQLDHVKALGQKIIIGSVFGLVIDLIWAAVLIAALGILWFYPPVAEFLSGDMDSLAGFLILVAAIAVFISSDFSIFAAIVTAVILFAVAGLLSELYKYVVPEALRTPVAANLIKGVVTVFLAFLNHGLPGSFRRNVSTVVHSREQKDLRRQFDEASDALRRRCNDIIDEVESLRKRVSDDEDTLLMAFYNTTSPDSGDKWEADKAGKALRQGLYVMEEYYRYIKRQAKAADPRA